MLQEILLVDDDKATNALNKIIINSLKCCKTITVKERGDLALDYINEAFESNSTVPDLILLDLNMPRMNGWEFLDQYHLLPPEMQQAVVVVMLTTSVDEKDMEKAREQKMLSTFENKPLTKTKMQAILNKFFPDQTW